MSKSLQLLVERRELVSIRRETVDRQRTQGFILAFSKKLILIQNIYDFTVDGFIVLRRKDITELKAGETDRFQRGLLLTEGILKQVRFDFRAPIESFDTFLASRPANEIVIVENEASDPPEFLIGTVASVARGTVTIRTFDGTAQLVEPPEEIGTNRITSCQILTTYANFYQRHSSASGDRSDHGHFRQGNGEDIACWLRRGRATLVGVHRGRWW